jgi:small subunit ribosomal protein S4
MRGRPRNQSDYAIELEARQNVKLEYGVKEALPTEKLEARLDNVVYRMGFSLTRPGARQLVSHRHITLNKRRVSIPSIKVKLGDSLVLAKNVPIPERFKKHKAPNWLKVNKKSLSGEVVGAPARVEVIRIKERKEYE